MRPREAYDRDISKVCLGALPTICLHSPVPLDRARYRASEEPPLDARFGAASKHARVRHFGQRETIVEPIHGTMSPSCASRYEKNGNGQVLTFDGRAVVPSKQYDVRASASHHTADFVLCASGARDANAR